MLAAYLITFLLFLIGIIITKIAIDGARDSDEAELKELQEKYSKLKVS